MSKGVKKASPPQKNAQQPCALANSQNTKLDEILPLKLIFNRHISKTDKLTCCR